MCIARMYPAVDGVFPNKDGDSNITHETAGVDPRVGNHRVYVSVCKCIITL